MLAVSGLDLQTVVVLLVLLVLGGHLMTLLAGKSVCFQFMGRLVCVNQSVGAVMLVTRIVQVGFALIGILSGFDSGMLSGLVVGLSHQIHA